MELYHHGVKGMKWGVRRYQDKNGKLTAAGKKRYSEGDKNDRPKKKLTPEQKQMIIGAVAVTAAVAVIGGMTVHDIYTQKKASVPRHVTSKHIGRILDVTKMSTESVVIPKGTKFHRFSSKSLEDYAEEGSRIYAAFTKKDVRLYRETMPDFIRRWGDRGIISDDGSKVYEHFMRAKSDIRIASPADMARAYMQATGAKEVEHADYINFMQELVDRSSPAAKTFQKILSDQGYNAVLDLNDAGWAEAPLILFEPGSILDGSKVRQLGKVARVINTLLM